MSGATPYITDLVKSCFEYSFDYARIFKDLAHSAYLVSIDNWLRALSVLSCTARSFRLCTVSQNAFVNYAKFYATIHSITARSFQLYTLTQYVLSDCTVKQHSLPFPTVMFHRTLLLTTQRFTAYSFRLCTVSLHALSDYEQIHDMFFWLCTASSHALSGSVQAYSSILFSVTHSFTACSLTMHNFRARFSDNAQLHSLLFSTTQWGTEILAKV